MKRWGVPTTLLATLTAGVLVGVMGALFQGALRLASARTAFIAAAEGRSIPGWLAGVLAGATAVSLAAWLARRYAPNAPQSPAPESAGALERRPSNLAVVAVNFAGTGVAVGAGLALGPERPAIQLGGAVGRWIGRLLKLSASDLDLLLAASGGAGVATMFNSPLGCAAYTVETVLKRVDLRISLMTLGVGAIAVGVTRVLLGRDVNFVVGPLPSVRFEHLLLFLLLGCGIGVLAWLHVHLIHKLTRLSGLTRLPGVARTALVGAAIGWLAWLAPGLVGVGDSLTQEVIDGRFAPWAMVAVFLVRFFLGPLSLAAGTPGGYFTPVLLLGGLAGGMYGAVVGSWLPVADIPPTAFVLAGMGVALASIARAPFTGILLVIETTGALTMALPMIVAVVGAAGIAHLLLRMPSMTHGLETALPSSKERTGRGEEGG